MKIMRGKLPFIIASVLLFSAFILSLLLGSTKIPLCDFFRAIFGKGDSTVTAILLYIRMPRAIASVLAGAALAVSGVVIQATLGNKLASPSLIGVNAGAGLGVTICCAVGAYGGAAIAGASFLGAILAMLLVTAFARHLGASRASVILAGVALSAFLGAISDSVLAVKPDITALSQDFKVGDFSGVSYQRLIPAAIVILVCLVITLMLSVELDVISLGEESAGGVGLSVKRTMAIFLILASLLAGAAVSFSGLLGFVGLIVPHFCRYLVGESNKKMLPLSALLGGALVCFSDLIARILFAPYEIPVGVVTAFIGAPAFVCIIVKRGRRMYD